jgi:hypothetical protein
VILAVQQWRPYLQHHEFVILTYHKSLTQLNEQRLHIPWQHKVFTKLLGLQYKVQYRPGSENRVADALSRCVPADMHYPWWYLNGYWTFRQAMITTPRLSLSCPN